jgi:site-specific DNA-methyltransferase (adenine-specific)
MLPGVFGDVRGWREGVLSGCRIEVGKETYGVNGLPNCYRCGRQPCECSDGITLYHEDAREVLPLLEAGSVDMMVTDPPYGIGLKNGDVDGHRSDRAFTISGDEDQSVGRFILDWAEAGQLPVATFASPWMPWPGQWRNLIVWDKGGAVGGGGDIRTCLKRTWELIQVARNGDLQEGRHESVWRYPIVPSDTEVHICAKPVPLVRRLLTTFARHDWVILDPFCGSGPTLAAAKQLGRHAIGIEIAEEHCQSTAERLRQGVLSFTGAE